MSELGETETKLDCDLAEEIAEEASVEEDGSVSLEDSEDRDDHEESDALLRELSNLDPGALLQAMLFAHAKPISASELARASRLQEDRVVELLNDIKVTMATSESALELVEVAGRYQLRTKSQFANFIVELKRTKPRRLSKAALETLAVVAYRQPIIKSDIEQIRGVDPAPTLKTLIDKRFVKIIGHQASVGHPALYGTTDQFLEVFGLRSLDELPTLRDLKEYEEEPGESEEASLSQ